MRAACSSPECSPAMTSRSGLSARGEGSSRIGEFPVSDIAGKCVAFALHQIRPQRKLNAQSLVLQNMATTTIENYVKRTIFFAEQDSPNRPVPMGIISKALGVVPGFATTMVKAMARNCSNTNPVWSKAHDQRHKAGHPHDSATPFDQVFLSGDPLKLDWGEIHEDAGGIGARGLGSYSGENRRAVQLSGIRPPWRPDSHRLMAPLSPSSIRVSWTVPPSTAYSAFWIKRLLFSKLPWTTA